MYQTEPPAAYWQRPVGPVGTARSCSRSSSWSPPISSPRRCNGRVAKADRPDAGPEAPSAAPAATAVGTELGRLAYWLVWLVGLIAALQPLGLSGVLTPVTALTNEVFAFLPRLLGAGAVLLRRPDPRAHRPPRHRSGARRAQPRAAARPRRHQHRRSPAGGRRDRHCHRRRRPGAQLDRQGGRRDRVGDHHHLRRDRRAADPADLGDLRPGDGNAQHHRAGHPATCSAALVVAGDRLPHRPLGQDADRNRPAQPRLRQ